MAKRLHLLLALFFMSAVAFAQPDDLMLVGYYDADQGDGWAVTIYNPTLAPIALSPYYLQTQNNGNNLTNTIQLSGVLPARSSIVVGNANYCNGCGGCNVDVGNATGVNGNDAIAITRGTALNFVDMINRWDTDIRPRINGQTNALERRAITRDPSNCIRYTSITGSGPNAWPSNTSTNFTGWVNRGTGDYSGNCLNTSFQLGASFVSRLPKDTTICNNGSVVLNTGAPVGTIVNWSNGTSGTSITVTASGRYIATFNPGTCEVRDTVDVSLVPGPTVRDTSLCPNVTTVTLDAGPGFATYLWSNGETTRTATYNGFGPGSVRVTSGSCTLNKAFNITPTVPPLGLRNDTTLCGPLSLPLTAAAGYDLYIWSNGETGRSITANAFGRYILTASKGTCLSRDTVIITECPPVILPGYFFPNIITPNNDGKNDAWSVPNLSLLNGSLIIVNRWGQKIEEILVDATGTFEWKPAESVSSGVYFIYVEGTRTDGQPIKHKSWLQVLR